MVPVLLFSLTSFFDRHGYGGNVCVSYGTFMV